MKYREDHIKEAEQLLDSARDNAKIIFGELLKGAGEPNATLTWPQKLKLDAADFAIRAAHVHAELALVAERKPGPVGIGGYA